ncbi:MAG: altronate dehydratase small subunit [Gammaproteobacteria bacterium]|jgi:altronate dehydratase small subunit
MKKIVHLNAKDNVVTSLAELQAGAQFDIELDGESMCITVRDAIPFAHKVAVRAMATGVNVLKYGEVIGRASKEIEPGEHVHIHNVESARGRGDLR